MENFMLLILFFLVSICILISTLKIRINFENIQISNIDENRQKSKLKHSYTINLEIVIFEYIKIIKIKLDKEKVRRILKNTKLDVNNIDMKKEIKNRDEMIVNFNSLKLIFKELNFNLEIGTDDIISTVSIFTILSTIIPILIRNNKAKVQYQIAPIYNTGNVINLWANGISEVHLVHIIYTLYIMKMKKGRNKDGRRNKRAKSSNRRAYDYSHG